MIFRLMMVWMLSGLAWVEAGAIDLSRMDDVPVLHEGRVMPLARYAAIRDQTIAELLPKSSAELKVFPLLHHGQNTWLTPKAAGELEFQDEEMAEAIAAWNSIAFAHESGAEEAMVEALTVYRQFIAQRVGSRSDIRAFPSELRRHRVGLWKIAGIGFLLFGIIISLIPPPRKSWPGTVFLLLWLIVIIDSFWLVELTGRVPVFSAAESVYFLGSAAAFIGLLIGWLTRARRVWIAAAFVAAAACFGHGYLMGMSDAMRMVDGLFSASWSFPLFAACSLAALASLAIAVVYVTMTWRSADRRGHLPELKILWMAVFLTTVVALLFGYVWALQAFGRAVLMSVQRPALALALVAAGLFVLDRSERLRHPVWYVATGLSLLLVLAVSRDLFPI